MYHNNMPHFHRDHYKRDDDPMYLVFGAGTNHRQQVGIGLVFTHDSVEYDYSYSAFGIGETGTDVALVRFTKPVKYTNFVRPACISASSEEGREYQQCHLAGWDAREEGKFENTMSEL